MDMLKGLFFGKPARSPVKRPAKKINIPRLLMFFYFSFFLIIFTILSPFVLAFKKFGKRSYFQRLPKVYSKCKIITDSITSVIALIGIISVSFIGKNVIKKTYGNDVGCLKYFFCYCKNLTTTTTTSDFIENSENSETIQANNNTDNNSEDLKKETIEILDENDSNTSEVFTNSNPEDDSNQKAMLIKNKEESKIIKLKNQNSKKNKKGIKRRVFETDEFLVIEEIEEIKKIEDEEEEEEEEEDSDDKKIDKNNPQMI